MEAALDEEMRQLMRADAERMRRYAEALQPWAQRMRSILADMPHAPLSSVHAVLCQEARTLLPENVAHA